MLQKLYLLALSAGLLMLACSKDGVSPKNKSSENKMLSFSFADLNPVVKGEIDTTSKTVDVIVPSGTDLKSIKPIIEISSGASISPASGVAQDFTKPVVYNITAENGNKQTITVTVKSKQSSCLIAQMNETTTLSDGRKNSAGYFYTYNSTGILQKVIVVYTADKMTYTDSAFFSYDQANRLIKITNKRDASVDITYKENTISLQRTVPFSLGGTIPYWSDQTFNEKGQLVSTSDFMRFRFEYNDKGNLVKKIRNINGNEFLVQSFEYDEMKNPYQKLYIRPSIFYVGYPLIFVDFAADDLIQANNRTKIINYLENGKVSEQFSISYVYNAEDYPVSYTVVGTPSTKGVITYTNCSNTEK